jgi:cobalamin biosynthesis protein CobD/CbiB
VESAALPTVADTTAVEKAFGRVVSFITSPWRLARTHNLNPWVFVGMSALGYVVTLMVYLPWFKAETWQLSFLILLRIIALVVPTYILLKGKRIAAAFNASLLAMFVVNTAWHVCYYVFL